MKRFCLTLDLKNDPQLIAEYKKHHEHVWPEVLASITAAGICDMQIYLLGNRLFMIMDAEDGFSFEKKSTADAVDSKVQEWEELMWRYQQALPQAQNGEKWVSMEQIFSLPQQLKDLVRPA